MSEQEPSIARDPSKLAKALGANEVIYVGPINLVNLITGDSISRIRAAKEAVKRVDALLDRTVLYLNDCIQPEALVFLQLSPQQHYEVICATEEIEDIKASVHNGQTPAAVCAALCDTYFKREKALADTIPGYALDDLGGIAALNYGFDADTILQLYQEASNRHQSGP
jgi:hypothetical protein